MRYLIACLFLCLSAEGTSYFTEIRFPAGEHVKYYHLLITSDANLKNPIHRAKLTTNSYQWQDPPAGKFYYAVKVQDHWNQIGPLSAPTELVIGFAPTTILPPTPLTPTETEIVSSKQIPMTWSAPKYTQMYTLQLSQSPRFANSEIIINQPYPPNVSEINLDSNQYQLQSGEYFWRIQGLGEDGVTRNSRVQKLVMNIPPEKKPEPTPQSTSKNESTSKNDKRSNFQLGALLGTLNYTQGLIEVSETIATAELRTFYQFSKMFDVDGAIQQDVAVFTNSLQGGETKVLRFDTSFAYKNPVWGDWIDVEYRLGFNYLSMQVESDNFGVATQIGPYLALVVRGGAPRTFHAGIRVSPLISATESFNTSNVEWELFGSTELLSDKWLGIFSLKTFNYTSQVLAVTAELTQLQMGISYRL